MLSLRTWKNESSKINFESGVRFGIGTFNLVGIYLPNPSLLPSPYVFYIICISHCKLRVTRPNAVKLHSTKYCLALKLKVLLKAIIHFRYRKKEKSSQIYKSFTGFTEGNGERVLLKYYSMKRFTF